jgi:hypothetical protein
VLNSFSSLKGKINTIITQKKFEEAIDIDMNFIGIDSTKIDSISKNSIEIIKKKNDSKRLEKGIVLYPNFIEIDSTKLNGISKKSSKILRNQRIQKSKAQIKKQ